CHSKANVLLVKAAKEIENPGKRCKFESRLLEKLVLLPSEFSGLFRREISQEISQDIASLSSIENEIEFSLGDFFSQYTEELLPRLPMCRMAIDDHTIHVKHHAFQPAHPAHAAKPQW